MRLSLEILAFLALLAAYACVAAFAGVCLALSLGA